MNPVEMKLPFEKKALQELKIGQWVNLNGSLLTARDAALRKVDDVLSDGKQAPVDFTNQMVYFVGPTPPAPGEPIGSAGPTTSKRMEIYMTTLFELGVVAVMGKGPLSKSAVSELQRFGVIYLAAAGGAGAFYGSKIRGATVEAYQELGPEAIYRMRVEQFPAVVAVDLNGGNLFEEGPKAYIKEDV